MPIKISIVTCSLMVLIGCSIVTPPLEKPVIEQKTHNWFNTQKISVFSSTASRRQVLVKFPESQICAEAPPDVAETILSSLALLIKKRTKDGPAEKYDADLELNKTLLTIADRLFERTQGAQFFRDGAFHLCLANMNESISANEFRKLYENLFREAAELIEIELMVGLEKSKALKYVKKAMQSEQEVAEIKKTAAEVADSSMKAVESLDAEERKAIADAEKAVADAEKLPEGVQKVNAEKKVIELKKIAEMATKFAEKAKQDYANDQKNYMITKKADEDVRTAVAEAEEAAIKEMLAIEARQKAADDVKNAIESAIKAAEAAEAAVKTAETAMKADSGK